VQAVGLLPGREEGQLDKVKAAGKSNYAARQAEAKAGNGGGLVRNRRLAAGLNWPNTGRSGSGVF